jgi:hypothetical protein
LFRVIWSVGPVAATALALTACGVASNSTGLAADQAQADANAAMASANAAANAAAEAGAAVAQTSSSPAAAESGWQYDTDKDEMRGTTAYFANLDSENSLEFGFPYHGGNATLHLRQRPQDGLNVIVDVDGQFTCASYMDDHVSVKFDNGPVEKFGCAEPSDGRTGELFIRGERKFVGQLKKSKKLIIEAEFYEHGRQQMVFNTAGLVWPPKAK